MKYDYIIVGAGLYGCVMAERLKSSGKSVMVIEKRSHVGGNCYSYDVNGITVHKYGPHVFHTDNEKVLNYIQRFANFRWFTHKVYSHYNGKTYNFPINLNTYNQFFNANITEQELGDTYIVSTATNLEDYAIDMIGEDLYKAFIRGYTFKQWGTDPKNLPADTIKRLPFRSDANDSYFDDKWQGVPVGGYTRMFYNMLDGIPFVTGVDYLKDMDYWNMQARRIVYTGPIDKYFDYYEGRLSWRSLDFEIEYPTTDNYQTHPVVHYPELKYKYTRITEYKHFHPEREIKGTVIAKEYPVQDNDNPYYPVNSEYDREMAKKYNAMVKKETRTHFGGRLAEYKYYDMDDVIKKALDDHEKIHHK